MLLVIFLCFYGLIIDPSNFFIWLILIGACGALLEMYGPSVKNRKQNDVKYSDNTFEEYNSFFTNLCEEYGDQFLKSHTTKIILNIVKEGNYHLLDYRDLSELTLKSAGENNPKLSLSYSSEQISECLKDYIEHLSETENSTNLVIDEKVYNDLWCKLSYLYKIKKEHKQRLWDDYKIKEFGTCLADSARDDSHIKDVSKLPFPKNEIIESLTREWKRAKGHDRKEILETGAYHLAFYQEGVGVEDLYMTGMDTKKYMKEVEKFPKEEQGMLLVKKLNSEEVKEHKKKWEHFNKLCEKDVTRITEMIIGITPNKDLTDDLTGEEESN